MPFNDVGFVTKRRGLGGQGGVTPAPSRNLTITPALSNNAETITWTIQSNMTFSPTLNYVITNLSNTDFTDGAVTGNITLNSSGSFTITRNLDRLANYSNSNITFSLQLINPESNVLLGQSSNAVVKPATPLTATGGDTVTVYDNKFTIHTYTTTGNSSFNISSLGDYPANLDVWAVVANGGGAGGGGFSYKESIFGAVTNYTQYGGNGGAAGFVYEGNIRANTLSVGTVGVSVGVGASNATLFIPGNSSFANIVPTGSTVSGQRATFDIGTPYNRSESAGGGGRGASGDGANAVATSFTNVRGGQGGNGVTTVITGSPLTLGCGGGGGGSDGGGTRGCSGGGNGGSDSSPYNGENATANRAGGGGGAGPPALGSIPDNTIVTSDGGNGGSGIVVVRYLSRYRNMALA
jgi:hypothetical protein